MRPLYTRKVFKKSKESILKDRMDHGLQRVIKGGVYRHYKQTTKLYRVMDIALDEATLLPVVIYKCLDHGLLWTRGLDNWCDTMIDDTGKVTKRFVLYE